MNDRLEARRLKAGYGLGGHDFRLDEEAPNKDRGEWEEEAELRDI